MNKKEINPFSIAFLDLMSGALAAVIILFVIVPKSDFKVDLIDDKFQAINTGFGEIDSIISSWMNVMSKEEITFILDKTSKMQVSFKELEESSRILQVRLDETKQENKQLNMRLNLAERKLEQLKKKEPIQPQTASTSGSFSAKTPSKNHSENSATETVTKESNPAKVEGKGDFLFGINAPFAAMITWEDNSYDVTLHLKDEKGTLCDFYQRKTSFAQWVKLPNKFTTTPYEAIIQNELAPGTYEIHAHIKRPKKGGRINIAGFVAINPEGGSPKKIDFGQMEITESLPPHRSGASTKIGTVIITENDIRWIKS